MPCVDVLFPAQYLEHHLRRGLRAAGCLCLLSHFYKLLVDVSVLTMEFPESRVNRAGWCENVELAHTAWFPCLYFHILNLFQGASSGRNYHGYAHLLAV